MRTPDIQLVVFTGTKAQFIKMVPIILEIERRGWPYRLIDTGQHADLVQHIIQQYGLREPHVRLAPRQSGVASFKDATVWGLQLMRYLFKTRRALRHELFESKTSLCLIHGDTASTLLAAVLVRRAGEKLAHVEAGLRSRSLLHPFPEELIRILVMRMAHLLFAPSQLACDNLKAMGLGARTRRLPGNTNMDTLAIAVRSTARLPDDLPSAYCVATIHRMETLYSRRRLQQMTRFLISAHATVPCVLVLHPPTQKRLRATGLELPLRSAGVTLLPLLDHASFVRLLRDAEFVMTDGGSVQEEAAYLGLPCLVMRKTSERDEGLGENALLSKLDEARISSFISNYHRYRRTPVLEVGESPSACLVDAIADLYSDNNERDFHA